MSLVWNHASPPAGHPGVNCELATTGAYELLVYSLENAEAQFYYEIRFNPAFGAEPTVKHRYAGPSTLSVAKTSAVDRLRQEAQAVLNAIGK